MYLYVYWSKILNIELILIEFEEISLSAFLKEFLKKKLAWNKFRIEYYFAKI